MKKSTSPIILDTDPGIDDIIALLYAFKAKLNILGVTTVHGNSTITNVTKNARYITDLLGSKVGVYPGSSCSLEGFEYFAESSGPNGISGYKFPEVKDKSSGVSALDFMHNTLETQKQKITFLCLGPLTNIAILFNLYPHLIAKIDSLVIMSSVFFGKGNITPYAEFNSYCDPTALSVVLEKTSSFKLPVTIIPAEVCREVWLTKKELQKLAEVKGLSNLKKIVEPYIEYYLYNQNYGGFPGAIIYDLLVPIFFIHDELFETEKSVVEVSMLHGEYYGKTTRIADQNSNVQVVRKVHSDKVKQYFFDSLKD